jgi:outer membrane receptor protein involved in Fe transport
MFIFLLHSSICSASNIVFELAQLSIEDLMKVTVSSVGFFDLPPEQAPGSIRIITTEQMENAPAVGLIDIVDLYVSGVHIGNTDRNGASYAVRGMRMSDNSTTIMMFDGNNINTSAGLGVNVNPALSLSGDISRLEIIKGPCSLVHGSGAMNGFINIVPKNGSDYPGYFYRMQYGFKDHMIQLENAYGFSKGKNDDFFIYMGTVYAEGFESQDIYGFDQTVAHPKQYSYHSRFFDPSFRLSMGWRHNNFRLFSFIHKEKGSSNAIRKEIKKPSEYYQGMFITTLSWESQLTPFEELEWYIPVSFFDFGGMYEKLREPSRFEEGGSECHIETRFVFKTHRLPKNSFAIGGLMGTRHFRTGDYYLSDDPDDGGLLMDSDWNEFGFFCEDIFHFSHQWHFSFGFRYDIFENDDFQIPNFLNNQQKRTDTYEQENNAVSTKRIAVSYLMTPNDTLKLSFQEGYHLSNLSNFYGIFFDPNYAQKDLEPELMSSIEFNYQHSEPEKGLKLGINLFLNGYENSLLVKTSNNNTNKRQPSHIAEETKDDNNDSLMNEVFGNGPSFASMGGELDIDWRITSQTNLFLSYAYTQPDNLDVEKNTRVSIANDDCSEWMSYPRHIIKGSIQQEAFNDRLLLHIHAIYTSSIDALSDKLHIDSQYYSPLFNIHASVSIKLSDQLTFQLIGRNIFDNDTPPVGFNYLSPWEGNLGEGSPLVYLGLTWKE